MRERLENKEEINREIERKERACQKGTFRHLHVFVREKWDEGRMDGEKRRKREREREIVFVFTYLGETGKREISLKNNEGERRRLIESVSACLREGGKEKV